MGLRLLAAGLLLVAVAPLAGCHRHHGPDVPRTESALAALDDPDPDRRKGAAEDLRDDDGPPASAVDKLLAAAQRETDGEAKQEMLITLGASGAAAARPLLEASLQDPDRDVRKGAKEGLERWARKNHAASPEQLRRIPMLKSPDAKERREAASDLRDDGGPPREAVGPLIEAARVERDSDAMEELLLTLGESGAPEAKPVIESQLEAGDRGVRRAAQKARKTWLARNGEAVRQDVQAQAPVAASTAAAAGAPAPSTPDGCEQFKAICQADPFDVAVCKRDTKALTYDQQLLWADCINASTLPCQKAHDTCVAKVRAATTL